MPNTVPGKLWLFAAVLVAFSSPTNAMVLSADEALEAFNLIVFEDLETSSGIEGRVYVGGNLSGASGTFFQQGNVIPPSALDALYVGGSISGGFKQVDNNGYARIGGDVFQLNMNAGTALIGGSVTGTVNGPHVTGASVTLPELQSGLEAESDSLALEVANSVISVAGNLATFNASPNADGLAIFDIPDGNTLFGSIMEVSFNPNGATTIVINVGGTGVLFEENVLGGTGDLISDLAIWNFYDATSVTITRQFFGAVLAPDASVTNTQQLNGTVVARSMTQSGAQIRLPTFTATLPSANSMGVPEPGHGLILAGGAIAIFLRRRNSRQVAS